jgi:hypothetical protein
MLDRDYIQEVNIANSNLVAMYVGGLDQGEIQDVESLSQQGDKYSSGQVSI